MVTAAQNPDGSIAAIIFNPAEHAESIKLTLGDRSADLSISAQAIQTVLIPAVNN
jgi:glucosylceramidase